MTVARALLVLSMLVAIGIAIVVIRQKSAQAANRIQGLHQQDIALEQKLWTKQLELARLREPQAIRRRAAERCWSGSSDSRKASWGTTLSRPE